MSAAVTPSPPPSSSVVPAVSGRLAVPRSGILAALWIPTDEHGELKTGALAAHLEWLRARGLHGVLALGSTGEFARMNLGEREQVLAEVIELAAPLPVVANISSIRLDEVVSLGRSAQKLGAVGVALMPPPFFPVTQEDMLEFFLRAAEAVDLPFYLYNYPEVTGNRIGLETISAFADRANMVGIKQSGGELSYHDDLIALGRQKDFGVFTAADPRLAEFLGKGAVGCLGGLANIVPEYMVEVFAACRQGHPEKAALASERLKRFGEILGPLPLPLNVRSGLEARGFDPGAFKTVVSAQTLEVYEQVVQNSRAAFVEWGLPLFRG